MDAIQFFSQSSKGCGKQVPFSFCPRCGASLETKRIEEKERPVCPVCGFIHFLNPSPGAVILIEHNGGVLLGRRCGRVRTGTWSLPGGYIDFEEDFLTAAHREVLEETGLHVRISSILSVVSNFISPSLHTLVIVLQAEITGGRERPGDDFDALQWIVPGAVLPDMAFDSDRHILERFAANPAFGAPVQPDLSSSPYKAQ